MRHVSFGMTRILVGACAAAVITGCAAAAPEPAPEPVSHDLTQADLDAVRAAWDAINEAEGRADWDAVGEMLTEDNVHFDPRTGPLMGKAAWREWVDSMEFEVTEPADYRVEELGGSGDLAYIVWTFSGSWSEGGTPVTTTGKGISIYRRQADGSWLVARNAWNQTPGADGGGN